MKICPACSDTYSERIDFCFRDGAVLQLAPSAMDAPMPRAMPGHRTVPSGPILHDETDPRHEPPEDATAPAGEATDDEAGDDAAAGDDGMHGGPQPPEEPPRAPVVDGDEPPVRRALPAPRPEQAPAPAAAAGDDPRATAPAPPPQAAPPPPEGDDTGWHTREEIAARKAALERAAAIGKAHEDEDEEPPTVVVPRKGRVVPPPVVTPAPPPRLPVEPEEEEDDRGAAWLVWGGVVAVLLLIVGSAGAWWLWAPDGPPRTPGVTSTPRDPGEVGRATIEPPPEVEAAPSRVDDAPIAGAAGSELADPVAPASDDAAQEAGLPAEDPSTRPAAGGAPADADVAPPAAAGGPAPDAARSPAPAVGPGLGVVGPPRPAPREAAPEAVVRPPTPAPAPDEVAEPPAPWDVVDQPTVGMVTVTSDPVGAILRIDGELKGKTPRKVKLPFGLHTLSLELDGYRTVEKSIDVQSAEPSFPVLMEPSVRSGRVLVAFEGWDGATLFVDGREVGRLPTAVNLAEGPHTFKVVGEKGSLEQERTVVLADRGLTRLLLHD